MTKDLYIISLVIRLEASSKKDAYDQMVERVKTGQFDKDKIEMEKICRHDF